MFVRLYRASDRYAEGEAMASLYLVDGQIVVETAEARRAWLRDFLREPIGWVRGKGRRVPLTGLSHPQEFLENLHRKYHGSRMWATTPLSDFEPDTIPLPRSPTTLATILRRLTPEEQRWLLKVVASMGESHTLRMWMSYRWQIDWVRNL
jgi:hypothetical protein